VSGSPSKGVVASYALTFF